MGAGRDVGRDFMGGGRGVQRDLMGGGRDMGAERDFNGVARETEGRVMGRDFMGGGRGIQDVGRSRVEIVPYTGKELGTISF